jgi:hypothetical protein
VLGRRSEKKLGVRLLHLGREKLLRDIRARRLYPENVELAMLSMLFFTSADAVAAAAAAATAAASTRRRFVPTAKDIVIHLAVLERHVTKQGCDALSTKRGGYACVHNVKHSLGVLVLGGRGVRCVERADAILEESS